MEVGLIRYYQVYENVFKTGENVLQALYQRFNLEIPETSLPDSQHTVALNTLPWYRREIVGFSSDSCLLASGNGNLLSLERIFPVSTERPVTIQEVSAGVFKLQNAQLSLKVEKGCITSLYDRKADREIIPLGKKANQFVIFDDKPIYWQAWDVEVYHLDTREELESSSTSITEYNYHRVSVTTKTKISDKSSMRVTISLSATFDESDYLSVECTAEIDWNENMKFLKVEFPVDIRSTEAAYETQYGIIRRPTHYNTSWDMAKFEVCCHKFADLSEHGYGVSILNDSKYGFATVGNIMRLSLLRSPKAPDDTADMGKHTIRWAIMPHEGGLGSRTVRAAFNFNNPLKLFVAKRDSSMLSQFPITLKGDNSLVLDTIKRGEDDEDISTGELPTRKGRSVILRIYDSLGGRSRGMVQTIWKVSKVFKTNLLEDDEEEVPVKERAFTVDLGPFQVGTYRICLAD
jgi:alpha-mannosidase